MILVLLLGFIGFCVTLVGIWLTFNEGSNNSIAYAYPKNFIMKTAVWVTCLFYFSIPGIIAEPFLEKFSDTLLNKLIMLPLGFIGLSSLAIFLIALPKLYSNEKDIAWIREYLTDWKNSINRQKSYFENNTYLKIEHILKEIPDYKNIRKEEKQP